MASLIYSVYNVLCFTFREKDWKTLQQSSVSQHISVAIVAYKSNYELLNCKTYDSIHAHKPFRMRTMKLCRVNNNNNNNNNSICIAP